MWVEWYMTHETGSQSTLDKATAVSTLGEKAESVGRLLDVCAMWHILPL